MKNVTVTLDDELLAAARVQAARNGTSLSRWIGALVERELGDEPAPDTAWVDELLEFVKTVDKGSGGERYSREEAHERRRLP